MPDKESNMSLAAYVKGVVYSDTASVSISLYSGTYNPGPTRSKQVFSKERDMLIVTVGTPPPKRIFFGELIPAIRNLITSYVNQNGLGEHHLPTALVSSIFPTSPPEHYQSPNMIILTTVGSFSLSDIGLIELDDDVVFAVGTGHVFFRALYHLYPYDAYQAAVKTHTYCFTVDSTIEVGTVDMLSPWDLSDPKE